GATALAALAIGFLPLFGGPGYESALALGLLLPLPVACCAAAGACPPRGRDVEPRDRSVLAGLRSAFAVALVVLAAALASVLLQGARAGFCDPLQGLELFALGPGMGTLIAAMWGSAMGVFAAHLGGTRRLWIAFALTVCGPLGGVVLSVWRF